MYIMAALLLDGDASEEIRLDHTRERMDRHKWKN